MSLDIGDALREGLNRSLKRNAALLFVAVLVVQLVSAVLSQTQLQAQYLQLQQQAPELLEAFSQIPVIGRGLAPPFPLALPISGTVAQLLGFVMAIPNEIVLLVAARTFVSEETRGLFDPTRNLPRATVSAIVAGLIVSFLVGLGTLLLVFPGLFLAVSFWFVREEVAVRDKGFVDAMTDSYALVKGNRFAAFGLMVVLYVVSVLVNLVTIALPPLPAVVVGVVVGSAYTVFAAAVVARAYRQLLDAESEAADTPGALTADDLEQEDPFGTTSVEVDGQSEGRPPTHPTDAADGPDRGSTGRGPREVDPDGDDDSDHHPSDPGSR